jgi:hypothetical protein
MDDSGCVFGPHARSHGKPIVWTTLPDPKEFIHEHDADPPSDVRLLMVVDG